MNNKFMIIDDCGVDVYETTLKATSEEQAKREFFNELRSFTHADARRRHSIKLVKFADDSDDYEEILNYSGALMAVLIYRKQFDRLLNGEL